jgi:tRNA pseudouridine38-40 synthase
LFGHLPALFFHTLIMSTRNIRIIVEYEGPAYSGWQIQSEQRTIQGELTEAIYRVTRERVSLTGAGRTDTGVHALGQVANFCIDHLLEAVRFRDAINYYLPDDILVKESSELPMAFHARHDARFRRYRYLIGAERSVVYRHLRWHCQALEFSALQECARLVEGEHDFSAFCVVSSRREANICRIDHCRWSRIGSLLIFEIRGNRFLHSMVRSLVGAMVNIAGRRRDQNPENLTLSSFGDMLDDPRERRVVFTAPACGLYLVSVGY